MKNKYLKYKKEIMHHFDNGVNYIDISKTHCTGVNTINQYSLNAVFTIISLH